MSKVKIFILFGLSWLLWIVMFRQFLNCELALIKDATSYYDHIQFFIKNMAQGIYPTWDPFWNYGTPNEFFLRRLGSFNPCYAVLIGLVKFGIPFKYAYLIFFSAYWFLGCLGFYKILITLTRNIPAAFTGHSLLLYSSLGTRIFDSFILLEFVPLAWFFFFLMRFIHNPQRYSLIGLSLTTLILMTTYIPFYFLTIAVIAVILIGCVYFKRIPDFGKQLFSFSLRHKWVTGLCVLSISASVLPGIQMYQQSRDGSIVMPTRNTASNNESVLTVQKQSFSGGGITDLVSPYEWITHLDDIELERFYVPCFALILFLIGCITAISQLQIVLILWAAALFIIGLNNATPIYPFLYDHIFVFKYFRNSFFFLWIAILPIWIALVSIQFAKYLKTSSRDKESQYRLLTFSLLIHGLFFIYIIQQNSILIGTYLSLGLSLIFFIYLTMQNRSKPSNAWYSCLFLFLIIVIQPLETYSYLTSNSETYNPSIRNYDDMPVHNIWKHKQYSKPEFSDFIHPNKNDLYITTPGHNILSQNIKNHLLNYFLQERFIAFDTVTLYEDVQSSLTHFVDTFYNSTNNALIEKHPYQSLLHDLPHSSKPHFEVLSADTSEFSVQKSTAVSIRLTTNWNENRLLVINDAVDKQWTFQLDGKPAPIFTAFHAMKGIFIPSGPHTIQLNYGTPIYNTINKTLLTLSYLLLILLIIFWNKDYSQGFHDVA